MLSLSHSQYHVDRTIKCAPRASVVCCCRKLVSTCSATGRPSLGGFSAAAAQAEPSMASLLLPFAIAALQSFKAYTMGGIIVRAVVIAAL